MTSTQINRRNFLRDAALVSVGLVGGRYLTQFSQSSTDAALLPDANAESRLKELNIELPETSKPLAIYVPAVRVGNLIYTSGTGPMQANGQFITGRVGQELSLEEGQAAARLTGLNTLAALKAELGSLNKVVRLVKVLGMVNCVSDFRQQPLVINGFSQLMVDVFGDERGKGARSAVGMGSLPGNIPVEIEAIFQVQN